MTDNTYTWYWNSASCAGVFDDIQDNIFLQLEATTDLNIEFIFSDDYIYEEVQEILSVCYETVTENEFRDHSENTYKLTLQK